QPHHRRRIARGERRERVEQDAPDEHPPPAEDVGEIPAEQAEDAARHGGHVEDDAHPIVDGGAVGRHVQQLDERRPHDERQHQQYVRIEREPDRGHDRDEPLQRRERCRFLVHQKYLASVAGAGREPGVQRDTTTISSAETSVMGTTGSRPSTIVPDAARVTTSMPPIEKTGTVPPGGAGTTDCSTATASTAAAVHTVAASAPHLVLSFQNSAATSSGDSAEYPANAYWVASSKMDCGTTSAMA